MRRLRRIERDQDLRWGFQKREEGEYDNPQGINLSRKTAEIWGR